MENRDESVFEDNGSNYLEATIGGYVSLKNNSKFVAQREGKKNDALTLKTILVDSQSLSKRAWDNALPPRIYG